MSKIYVARIIGDKNDPDFITLEVGKRDSVSFTLNPDLPDQFHTIVFVRPIKEDGTGGVETWDPFE